MAQVIKLRTLLIQTTYWCSFFLLKTPTIALKKVYNVLIWSSGFQKYLKQILFATESSVSR